MSIEMILSCTPSGGIGLNNKIPWKSDLKFFKKITTHTPSKELVNAVIMGRKTFESIGKCLAGRINIVISSKKINHENYYVRDNIYDALHLIANQKFKVYKIFLIGGKRIYEEGLPICSKIYLTPVAETKCDVFVNFYKDGNIRDFARKKKDCYIFHKNHDEFNYLNLVKKTIILPLRGTRSIKTKSDFGGFLNFDLKSFPLLTTKRVFWRGVVEELLWFLRGQTNPKILEAKKVFIWKDYGNNLGPIYGKQWRDFGGVDQIKYCLDLIKNEPHSRRIFMSSWNPPELDKMALPPCHISCQFSVQYGKLSAFVYQRSADIGLGLPFNIASYALLVYIFAKITDLQPGVLNFALGDYHIYENHVSALQEQLGRSPLEFPILEIKKKMEPWDYNFEDFDLQDYNSHAAIKMEMTA